MDHRALAAQTYNETWDLLEALPGNELDLLGTALTSRYHWGLAGGPREKAVADWMVSRCFAALGVGSLAVAYASAALEQAPADAPAWLLASLHEGRARAAAAAGDSAARAEHLALAHAALDRETDEEDRALIAGQIADVPEI